MERPWKIWFTGSHGTGKTTQMDYFLSIHPSYHKVDMERRDLHHKGIINLNKRAAPWDEIVIGGNAMLAILSAPSPSISDRSWIDKCAYSQVMPFSEDLLNAYHIVNTRSFTGFGDNDMYFYFPPVLPIEDDGVRSTDPEYQLEVDYWIQYYLSFFKIPYHTIVQETVQNRHLEIEAALKWEDEHGTANTKTN